MKHGIIKWPEALCPVTRAPHGAAISRAVNRVVRKMKPPSFCYCGRNCAVNRKHTALLKLNKLKSSVVIG